MAIIVGESLGKIWTGVRDLYASVDHWSAEKASKELIEGTVKIAGVAWIAVACHYGHSVSRIGDRSLVEVFRNVSVLFPLVHPGIGLGGLSVSGLLQGGLDSCWGLIGLKDIFCEAGALKPAVKKIGEALSQKRTIFLWWVFCQAIVQFAFKFEASNISKIKGCWGERKIQEFSSYCAPKLASVFYKKGG
jgi:hypothetical protein